MDPKIPEAIKKTPRCPLCFAPMEKMHNEQVQQRLEVMVAEAVAKAKERDAANDVKGREKARQRLGLLDTAIKHGAAYVFSCHFCKIACACNDPFVGKWEMVYALVGKEECLSCGTEMRFFCTATGYAQLACPAKKCRAKIERSLPDRLKQEAVMLVDDKGEPIDLPNVRGAVATPQQLSEAQVGGSGKDPALPDVTTIPMPQEGNA